MQDAAAVSTERLPVELERPLAALTVCAVATQLREAEELETTASQDEDGVFELPMFELDPMLPGQVIRLNVFEPRYVTMIRRCSEASSKFGMMASRYNSELSGNYPAPGTRFTEVHMDECLLQRDGRYHVRAVGVRMLEVVRSSELDGYLVVAAKCVPAAAAVDESLLQLSEALVPLVDTWLAQIRAGWERGPDHLASVQRELGVMPSLPEARAVWVAALINPLPGLGVAQEIRPAMLRAGSAEEMIQLVTGALNLSIRHTRPGPLCRAIRGALGVEMSVPIAAQMQIGLPILAMVLCSYVKDWL